MYLIGRGPVDLQNSSIYYIVPEPMPEARHFFGQRHDASNAVLQFHGQRKKKVSQVMWYT